MSKIDTPWFMDRITAKYKSLRQFAEAGVLVKNEKPIDRSQIWRMLHGERKISIDEARQLAKILDESLEDILKRIE